MQIHLLQINVFGVNIKIAIKSMIGFKFYLVLFLIYFIILIILSLLLVMKFFYTIYQVFLVFLLNNHIDHNVSVKLRVFCDFAPYPLTQN